MGQWQVGRQDLGVLRQLPSCCAGAEPLAGSCLHRGSMCWAGMLEHGNWDWLPNPAVCSWDWRLRGDVFWGDGREICR